jgi:tRNA (cmo5U34)-methyltransferase
MTIDKAFDQTVAYYDDWMKRALPSYDDLFGVATRVMPFESGAPIRVLDLGAGTGLFSEHVLAKYPDATFVLYDLAAKMLDVAKDRFDGRADQFEFVLKDYRELGDVDAHDLVISSLSIHHLVEEDKRALFHQIYTALKDGGVFVHIDQVKGETPYLQDLYWETWLQRVRTSGAPEEQIQESIERRQTYDIDAPLVDQLQWLREAGFENVDCVFKHTFMAVFLAMKRSTQ